MAKKIITTTEYTDDLDGSAAIGTVTFSYDGIDYEIDLNKKNKTALDKALKPYIDAARKVRGTRTRRPTGSSRTNRRTDLADIRAWAKSAGKDISARGRVPVDIIAEYDASH